MFRLESIDHVALAVRDVKRSAAWYQGVLGLERRHEAAWGDCPAVVGVGQTSLALFPVEGDAPKPSPGRDVVAMRHVAFRADAANFQRAQDALAPTFGSDPVLCPKAGDPREMLGIIRHQCESDSQRVRGDQRVELTDRGALASQGGRDGPKAISGGPVEW